jgi:hypothetical protein
MRASWGLSSFISSGKLLLNPFLPRIVFVVSRQLESFNTTLSGSKHGQNCFTSQEKDSVYFLFSNHISCCDQATKKARVTAGFSSKSQMLW